MAIWEVLLLFTKFFVYLGAAAVSGGYLFVLIMQTIRDIPTSTRKLWQTRTNKYVSMFALLGVFATSIDFFFQVGALSQTGFLGMFDRLMQDMVIQSTLGSVAIARLSVFIFAVVLSAAMMLQLSRKAYPSFLWMLAFALIQWAGIAYMFMLSGHTAQLDSVFRYALALHVVMAFGWMGALWLLSDACKYLSPKSLHELMVRFGNVAIGLVSFLVIAGALLAWKLIGSVSDLFSHSYGLALLTKFVFVTFILAIAAWHKFKLTPMILNHPSGASMLRHSINIEMVVGICIFTVTIVLSTVIGPPS